MTLLVWDHPIGSLVCFIDRDPFGKLRKASGKLSNFILIRVVRLTIETNALTASVVVATLVLYVTFPDEVYYAFLYSNTLLVSLNNRIYFRDHQPERGSILVSGQFPATSQAPINDSFRPCTNTQTVELDKSSGDDTSINWSPPYPRKAHLLPEDPECPVETLLPADSRKDGVHKI
ncbi:hypothetical protein BJY52DRAFT_1226710 [Lactarius psammicola]|nr:hypothetical protein BJY52DRAFT_1226710 [Lactarius psammicola]